MITYKKIIYQSLGMLLGLIAILFILQITQTSVRTTSGLQCSLIKQSFLMPRCSLNKENEDKYDCVYLDKGAIVTPIAIFPAIGNGYIVHVETADKQKGYIKSSDLSNVCIEDLRALPRIRQTYILPVNYNHFSKNVLGKKISEVEKKYGPFDSIILNGSKGSAYYCFIDLIKDNQRYLGVKLTIDSKAGVVSVEPDREKKKRFVDDLIFSGLFRIYELFGLSGSRYESWTTSIGSFFQSILADFESLGWFAVIVSFFLKITLFIVQLFLVFSIPQLFAYPLSRLVWYNNNLSRTLTNISVFAITLLCYYLFFLLISISSYDSFDGIFYAVFLVWAMYFWYIRTMTSLDYNRCPSCNTMNLAMNIGSQYTGKSQNVLSEFYNLFKYRSITADAITDHYESREKQTIKDYDHYSDHRQCRECGHTWTVTRRVFSNERVKDY